MLPTKNGGVRLGTIRVPSIAMVGGATYNDSSSTAHRPRHLDWDRVLRSLGPVPRPRTPVAVKVIFDESGSITSGNDAVGARHEATAIFVQHLASHGGKLWEIELITFDRTGDIDVPPTVLDRRGTRRVLDAAMSTCPGSGSNLGPALNFVGSRLAARPTLLVVMSDWELFDPDPAAVIDRFASSAATETLAVVLRSTPPEAVTAGGVQVVRVDPEADDPAAIAHHLVAAARRLAESRLSGEPRWRPSRF